MSWILVVNIVRGKLDVLSGILGIQSDDDSGAAHAIEHLVFKGSKKFPQKVMFEISWYLATKNCFISTEANSTLKLEWP